MFGSRLSTLFCGGAPLSVDSQYFARNCLDVKLLQGYAATETAGVCCCIDFFENNLGRTGAPLAGAQVKLVDWEEGNYRATDKPHPRGEIVVGGDFVSIGYLNNEEATREAIIEEDGVRWFMTGDIGEIYPDGTFKIIDRKKDLVKLQLGEYVALGKVEAELKNCELVENICIHGNGLHNYVVGLVIPNQTAINRLALELGLENQGMDQLCANCDLRDRVLAAIQVHGKKAGLHKSEIPAKIKLCPETWTPDNNLVTALLKVRRKQIAEFYANDIQNMYS
jgi:long-chain acyl-CoA synthetase